MANALAVKDQSSPKQAISSISITPGRATALPIEAESCLTFESSMGVEPPMRQRMLAEKGFNNLGKLRDDILVSLSPSGYTKRKELLSFAWEAKPKSDAQSRAKSGSWLITTVRLTEHLPLDIFEFALDTVLAQSKFLPDVSEILAVADPLLAKRRQCASRLNEILAYVPPPSKAEQEKIDPDVLARILKEEWPSHGKQEAVKTGKLKIPNKSDAPAFAGLIKRLGITPPTGE